MRSEKLFAILRKAAEVSGRTAFVVIGSQAIHGTIPDPDIDIVVQSNDVDLYPVDGYTDIVWEQLMLHLGQDSDFHVETDTYIEAVQMTLARFPSGWESRAKHTSVGTVFLKGKRADVKVLFPDIYDLTVSKVAIRREKDLEFLEGVVSLGLVDRDTLLNRYEQVPRITDERLAEGLADIQNAFGNKL